MSILNRLKRTIKKILGLSKGTITYSQCGEDLIVSVLFGILGIKQPNYLEIGTNHPFDLNNTYLFYSRGNCGVCVEPDPVLCELIRRRRPRDICLNVGISGNMAEQLPFYVMSLRALSTFSKEVAERVQSYGKQRIMEIRSVDCIPVNDVLRQYFPERLDFVSLDTEGNDLTILEAFDFSIVKPVVFCVETITYEEKESRKMTEIIDFMLSKGYFIFAETYINTIFVNQARWNQQHSASLYRRATP